LTETELFLTAADIWLSAIRYAVLTKKSVFGYADSKSKHRFRRLVNHLTKTNFIAAQKHPHIALKRYAGVTFPPIHIKYSQRLCAVFSIIISCCY